MASNTRRRFQQMVPNKEIVPKIDNLVFEYKPSHPTLQLGQAISASLGLNKSNGGSESYVYAPRPAQASETAYYLQVTPQDFDHLFVYQKRASVSSVFVSVSLVKDLINGENTDWTQELPKELDTKYETDECQRNKAKSFQSVGARQGRQIDQGNPQG
ncbi:hypothetical protein Neosp_012089 [[Neocosmospora] mangrovei]